nr:Neurochondrin-domain-containing protein [Syncephalis plumigaleata]
MSDDIAGTNSTVLSAELQRCLDMLQSANSDEERFVALLMLPRLLEATNQQQVNISFSHIDDTFIERLLHSNKGDDAALMRSLAIHVLTFFARADPDLLKERSMLTHIPSEGEQAEETRNDILELFSRVATIEQGARWMWHQSVYESVMEQWINGSDTVSQQAIQVLQQSLLSTTYLDRKSGRDAARVAEFLCRCLPWITEVSVQRADKHKLDGLNLLTTVMASVPAAIIRLVNTDKNAYNKFVHSLKSLLVQVLASKSASEVRDNAIQLEASMMYHFGHDWLYMPATSGEVVNENEASMSSTQLASLSVRLASIEARLGVDELALLRNQPTATVAEVETKSKRFERLLPACFGVLEHTIHFFATALDAIENDENTTSSSEQTWNVGVFNIDQVLQLQKTLHETFEAVLAFLDDQLTKQSVEEALRDNIILASLRAICTWLAEDESMHVSAVCLIPAWIQLLTPARVKEEVKQENEADLDVASIAGWLCPAVIHCMSQPIIRETFANVQGTTQLGRWVAREWMTSKDEVTRNKRVARQFIRQATPCLDVLMAALQIDWSDILVDTLEKSNAADTQLAGILPGVTSVEERQALLDAIIFLHKQNK